MVSNRDESPGRWTNTIEQKQFGKTLVVFPVDPLSGGSWIGVSNQHMTGCILNGAFEKHQRTPPYSRSRGLVLLDYFKIGGIEKFVDQCDLTGIEPFTLVVFEHHQLFEFRWNGDQKYLKELPINSPHFWNSRTLYDQKATNLRKTWFYNWLSEKPDPEIDDLINFHRYGGNGNTYDGLVINRDNKVQTLSITGIKKQPTTSILHHHDLIKNDVIKQAITLVNKEHSNS
jgi:hypothetical protein